MHPHRVRSPWCTKRTAVTQGLEETRLRDGAGDGAAEVVGAAERKKASLPSDLFIDSGVWGPLMDEQPHYLGISFPGCQVQRVTAFRISHVGQRIVPQKNLDHIPGRQKSTMSLQNAEAFPTNSSSHIRSKHNSLSQLRSPLCLSSLPSFFLLFHKLLGQPLMGSWVILGHTTMTLYLLCI